MTYVYRKFGITKRFKQRFNIEETKERSQIRLIEVKKVTYGETLLRQSHFILESKAQSMSLEICISFFTIYSGSNI